MAREFKAFVRAKKVKTPQQLLRVVFLYCGLDKSLRETAADFTLLYESITHSSIAERLAACLPWVQAVLAKMLHTNAVSTLPAPWRFLVIYCSHVQGPGAQGTQYRLHICMDLVQLQFVAITLTISIPRKPRPLPVGPGILRCDRGYAYATPIVETSRNRPRHPPDEPCPPARVRRTQRGTHAGIAQQPWETSHTIDVHVQASASPMRARLYPRVSSVREQANVAHSASAPRV